MSFSIISHSPAELDELVFLLGVSRVREGFVGRGCLKSLSVIKRFARQIKGERAAQAKKTT